MFAYRLLLILAFIAYPALSKVEVEFLSNKNLETHYRVSADYAMGDVESKKDAREYLVVQMKRASVDEFGQLVESTRQWTNQAISHSTIAMLSSSIMKFKIIDESINLDTSGRIKLSLVADVIINEASLQQEVESLRGVRLKQISALSKKHSLTIEELQKIQFDIQQALSKTSKNKQTIELLSERRNLLDHLLKVNETLSLQNEKMTQGDKYLSKVALIEDKSNAEQELFQKAVEDIEVNFFKAVEAGQSKFKYKIRNEEIKKNKDGLYTLFATVGWSFDSFSSKSYFSDTELTYIKKRSRHLFIRRHGLNQKVSFNKKLIEHFKGRNFYLAFEYGNEKVEYVLSKGISLAQSRMRTHYVSETLFGNVNRIGFQNLTKKDIENNGEITARIIMRNEES